MKRRILYLLLIAIVICSCNRNNDNATIGSEEALYKESFQIGKLYLDSITHAKDSTTVIRLMKNYEMALTHINYKYPADTYVAIPQSDNDTLTKLTLRIVAVHDSILYRLAHPAKALPDSLASDTTSNKPDSLLNRIPEP